MATTEAKDRPEAPKEGGDTATKQEKKKTRKKKTTEKAPRLNVLSVEETVVECHLETVQQGVQQTKFKFDINNDEPEDVSKKMVGCAN